MGILKISTPYEEKLEWYNTLTFQDLIDLVLKDTIVSFKWATLSPDRGIDSRGVSYSRQGGDRYWKFSEKDYRNIRLKDMTEVKPETLLKDVKMTGLYYSCLDYLRHNFPKLSINKIKQCESKRDLCKAFFRILKPYLYFRIFDYDYWNIIKVISRDPNAYQKDKSSEIDSINSELWELEKEYESKRKKLEKRLDSAKIYNNIYKNIKDD